MPINRCIVCNDETLNRVKPAASELGMVPCCHACKRKTETNHICGIHNARMP